MENPRALIGQLVYMGATTTELDDWLRVRVLRNPIGLPKLSDIKLVVGVDLYVNDEALVVFHDGDGWAADTFEKYWVALNELP